tara:strand:- start:1421 stop:1909 length:489 start_codon:yes stop_codon:yes gene_type:complete
MLIKLINKNKLIVDEFIFQCCIGKNGITNNKIEGDFKTPKGKFNLGDLFYKYKKDVKESNLNKKKIKKNMGWCNNINSKNYNKLIKISKNEKYEKIFRKDYKYDLMIPIEYNYKKVIPNKGSAIFLHITKNYKGTAGCIALSKKDFLIMIKILNKKNQILIS